MVTFLEYTHTHARLYKFFPFARNEDTDINVYIQLYEYVHTHTATYTRTRRYILLRDLQQMHIQYALMDVALAAGRAQYTHNGSTTQANIKT